LQDESGAMRIGVVVWSVLVAAMGGALLSL
jgi:hypothetical protein